MTLTVMDVTLDPGRAHPKLVLSKDQEKEANEHQKENKLPLLQITAREKLQPHDRVGLDSLPHLAPLSCCMKEGLAPGESCSVRREGGCR